MFTKGPAEGCAVCFGHACEMFEKLKWHCKLKKLKEKKVYSWFKHAFRLLSKNWKDKKLFVFHTARTISSSLHEICTSSSHLTHDAICVNNTGSWG